MSNPNPLLAAVGLPAATQSKIIAPAGAMGQIISPLLVPHKDRRADLLWGRSKVGKGINAFMGADWMLKTYGKKFLYLTAEPGAMPKIIEDYTQAGLGDVFSVINQPHLLAILSTVLEGGKWPVYLKKNDGSIVRSFKAAEAACNPDEYGLLIVDSLTSLGDEILKWYTNPANQATIHGTMGEDKFNIKDSGEGMQDVHIHAVSMTQIGEACRFLHRLVTASAALPYMKVLWIAREQRANRGEKKDMKTGNIIVAGEPMYGPDLPGTASTPRVTSWFGGAYHCDAVPKGGVQDDRPTAASGNPLMASQAAKLATIPGWEYRLYLRPHPDASTGLLYDAGNRMPPHIEVPPFITCTVEETPAESGNFKCQGLNTVWEMERTQGVTTKDALRTKFSDVLSKFGGGKQ